MQQGIDDQSILDRLRIHRMTRDEASFAIDMAAEERDRYFDELEAKTV